MVFILFLDYEVKGAKRWIQIFTFTLQPSEIIKAFNDTNLSLLPFAKAIDITGEGSIELIEAYEIKNSPVETSLPDANWVSLQNICNS